ncbi:MAG: hypothetical protein CL743_05130 [Chloroflexi bacterium]|nr:hypothetical protein [Chloroflexota bacterium]
MKVKLFQTLFCVQAQNRVWNSMRWLYARARELENIIFLEMGVKMGVKSSDVIQPGNSRSSFYMVVMC